MLRASLLAGFPATVLAGTPSLCCSTPDLPSAAVTRENARLTIDLRQAPELRRKAGFAKFVSNELNLIVVHPDKHTFVALGGKCTHGGGMMSYNPSRRTVQCTCWGHSEFSLSGDILGGPAKRPLARYTVEQDGNELRIQLEPAKS
jgi:Rieske Fe-S protein